MGYLCIDVTRCICPAIYKKTIFCVWPIIWLLIGLGLIVLPIAIRRKLGLGEGTQFLVVTDNENILLKPVKDPSLDEFYSLIEQAQKTAAQLGLTEDEINAGRLRFTLYRQLWEEGIFLAAELPLAAFFSIGFTHHIAILAKARTPTKPSLNTCCRITTARWGLLHTRPIRRNWRTFSLTRKRWRNSFRSFLLYHHQCG